MADHMYKLSEIPPKKRLAHFWEYYKAPTLIVLICSIIVISMIYLIFFKPKADVSVMLASSKVITTEAIEKFEEELYSTVHDYNEDDKILIDFNPIITDETNDLDIQHLAAARNKLYATLMTGEYIIQIVDDSTIDYLRGERIMGTYADFEGYNTGKPSEEEVKIPLKEIPAFKESLSTLPHDYYLTIRSRVSAHIDGNKKKTQNYENHIDMVAKMVGFEKK